MAYLEVDVLVAAVEYGLRLGAAATRVVDYEDSVHVKVYDRPFTGGDDDILLLEHRQLFPWFP